MYLPDSGDRHEPGCQSMRLQTVLVMTTGWQSTTRNASNRASKITLRDHFDVN